MRNIIYFNRFLAALLIVSLGFLFHALFFSGKIAENPTFEAELESSIRKKVIYLPRSAIEDFGEGLLGSRWQHYQKEILSELEYMGFNSRPDQENKVHFFKWKGKNYSLNDQELLSFSHLDLQDYKELSPFFFALKQQEEGCSILVFDQKELMLSFVLSDPVISKPDQIGSYRFDKNFLVRQKISWVGQDLFLKKYGEKEYPKGSRGDRIDFVQKDRPYSCFLEKGDLLVFKEDHWQVAGEDSKLYPILRCESIEDKYLNLSIWTQNGLVREKFQISKGYSKPIPKKISTLRFVGAKTKRKWLIQNNKQRFSVESGDWLIHKNASWQKIAKLDELEAYIEQINLGELFIVKELKQIEGQKYLVGDLFNSNRTELILFELVLETEKIAK